MVEESFSPQKKRNQPLQGKIKDKLNSLRLSHKYTVTWPSSLGEKGCKDASLVLWCLEVIDGMVMRAMRR